MGTGRNGGDELIAVNCRIHRYCHTERNTSRYCFVSIQHGYFPSSLALLPNVTQLTCGKCDPQIAFTPFRNYWMYEFSSHAIQIALCGVCYALTQLIVNLSNCNGSTQSMGGKRKLFLQTNFKAIFVLLHMGHANSKWLGAPRQGVLHRSQISLSQILKSSCYDHTWQCVRH